MPTAPRLFRVGNPSRRSRGCFGRIRSQPWLVLVGRRMGRAVRRPGFGGGGRAHGRFAPRQRQNIVMRFRHLRRENRGC